MPKEKRYQPSPEERQKAEDEMSETQKLQSKAREEGFNIAASGNREPYNKVELIKRIAKKDFTYSPKNKSQEELRRDYATFNSVLETAREKTSSAFGLLDNIDTLSTLFTLFTLPGTTMSRADRKKSLEKAFFDATVTTNRVEEILNLIQQELNR